FTVAGARRNVGNVIADASIDGESRRLIGFENHSGRTFITESSEAEGTSPLAQVVIGNGNNGEDGSEGARFRGAVGTYLHGPILPKNPWLADFLLLTALRKRTGPDATLQSLDDSMELRAHEAVVSTVMRKGNAR